MKLALALRVSPSGIDLDLVREAERLGEDVMDIGASPIPNTEHITNCPGLCPRLRPLGSSIVRSSSGPSPYWWTVRMLYCVVPSGLPTTRSAMISGCRRKAGW